MSSDPSPSIGRRRLSAFPAGDTYDVGVVYASVERRRRMNVSGVRSDGRLRSGAIRANAIAFMSRRACPGGSVLKKKLQKDIALFRGLRSVILQVLYLIS